MSTHEHADARWAPWSRPGRGLLSSSPDAGTSRGSHISAAVENGPEGSEPWRSPGQGYRGARASNRRAYRLGR